MFISAIFIAINIILQKNYLMQVNMTSEMENTRDFIKKYYFVSNIILFNS